MNWFTSRNADDEARMLALKVAQEIGPAIAAQAAKGSPIVVIGRINVTINYASGGGATVNVGRP